MSIRAIGAMPPELAALLGGGPTQEQHPQAAAGSQFVQAQRLAELAKLYMEHPGNEMFTPGDLIRMRPQFSDVNPLRYPHKDYPAVVISTDPVKDGYKTMGYKPDSVVQRTDLVIGILMQIPDEGNQHWLFYTADSRFFEHYPKDEMLVEGEKIALVRAADA